ncbi:lytic transglycosylase, partial [Acinetobacter baumannii]|nr:lytic transglycosylase [Acinetobacter baumannii]
AYGTTKIMTTDSRARWVHGGGSGLSDPYAEKQGWRVTMGCTRAQNIDVENLAKKITEFKKQYPKIKIKYIRDSKGTYPK